MVLAAALLLMMTPLSQAGEMVSSGALIETKIHFCGRLQTLTEVLLLQFILMLTTFFLEVKMVPSESGLETIRSCSFNLMVSKNINI